MKIDAHQHFWDIERGDYGWLTPDLKPLYKNFTPADLQPLLKTNDVDGTVLVQAAPTLAETRYMMSLATDNEFIKGVVGWVDFEASDVQDTISELAALTKLVGIRPMIHDIEDTDWMLKEQFSPVYAQLIRHNLVFDALTRPVHLNNLKQLLDRHPDLNVVIDHASKPAIEQSEFTPWADSMEEIAATSNASVKLSGMVTEAGSDWTVELLKPYVDHLLEHFGPGRLIWGSDWPVCILASTYDQWHEATNELLKGLNETETADVLGHNAIRVYGLKV